MKWQFNFELIMVIKELVKERERFTQELLLARYSIISMLILLIINFAFFYSFVQYIINAFDYVPFLVLGIFTSVFLVTSCAHVQSFGGKLSCQYGMMVGMTLGMVSGFLVGALIAATNGMFIGSLVGIIIGIIIGVYSSKIFGIMGIMEGMMAGIMSGLMGPMTIIMTLNDNMLLLLYFLFIILFMLLGGLSYMLIKARTKKTIIKKVKLSRILFFSFILNIIILLIMFFAPKGPLTFI